MPLRALDLNAPLRPRLRIPIPLHLQGTLKHAIVDISSQKPNEGRRALERLLRSAPSQTRSRDHAQERKDNLAGGTSAGKPFAYVSKDGVLSVVQPDTPGAETDPVTAARKALAVLYEPEQTVAATPAPKKSDAAANQIRTPSNTPSSLSEPGKTDSSREDSITSTTRKRRRRKVVEPVQEDSDVYTIYPMERRALKRLCRGLGEEYRPVFPPKNPVVDSSDSEDDTEDRSSESESESESKGESSSDDESSSSEPSSSDSESQMRAGPRTKSTSSLSKRRSKHPSNSEHSDGEVYDDSEEQVLYNANKTAVVMKPAIAQIRELSKRERRKMQKPRCPHVSPFGALARKMRYAPWDPYGDRFLAEDIEIQRKSNEKLRTILSKSLVFENVWGGAKRWKPIIESQRKLWECEIPMFATHKSQSQNQSQSTSTSASPTSTQRGRSPSAQDRTQGAPTAANKS